MCARTGSHRLRVLAVAYACNPRQGSEEGVGWGWVNAIAANHRVDVVTAAFHRPDIEYGLAEGAEKLADVRFHYVAEKPWHYRPSHPWKYIENGVLKPIMNLAYAAWQRDAYRLASQLDTQIGFDLVHLITYVGFRFPGRFWKLDLPLVWGPIGGLENTPVRFLPLMGAYGCTYYACRNLVNALQRRWLPGPRRAMAKAARTQSIIAATEGIRREIDRWYGHPSEVICEIGPPSTIAETHTLRQPDERLRLVWNGQHLPGKALPLLLKALAGIDGVVDYELTVLGAGPCSRKWQRLAGELGIGGKCRWPGWMRRDEAIRVMGQAHVSVITSLKDLTSTVLLESLAAGLPVVCPDHCGFSNVVTSDCGIKVPVRSPQQLVGDLATAIERLACDEAERRRLAAGALRRIQDFSWDRKAETVAAIYRRAVESRSGIHGKAIGSQGSGV